mgnify:CR=1 FL=1
MKAYGLREATDFLPAEQRGELVAAWLAAGVDYLVLYRDPQGPGSVICRVGAEGEFGTLAKALRSVRHGRPYAYIESLHFLETRLTGQAEELRQREEKVAQATEQANQVGEIDAVTAQLLDMDMAQRETGERLLEWERRLKERERDLQREAETLVQRSEYVSHVENSLMERLDEMNRRTEEIEQMREDLDRRESQLSRKTGKPNLRLISGE